VKIGVIGSTGRTGRLVLDEGLRRGHVMTAFTRRPRELAGVQGLAAVVHGDGRNLEDIRRAVRGQDAVIACPRRRPSPRTRRPVRPVEPITPILTSLPPIDSR